MRPRSDAENREFPHRRKAPRRFHIDEGGIPMKKLATLLLALALVLSLLAVPAMAEDTAAAGVLSYLNMTDSEYDASNASVKAFTAYSSGMGWLSEHGYLQLMYDTSSPALQYRTVFYDSIDALLMALNVGDVICITDIPQTTGQYLCAQNDALAPLFLFDRDKIEADGGFAMDCFGMSGAGYSFMMKADNTALRDDFNAVIAEMKADGTLNELVQKHIFAAIAGEEIAPIEMDSVEGRETIKVAVTGSLPPMDYVAADGTFAGFNTAMLAEIGRRLDRNIEIVQVDSLGRAAALASGTVDAVFWTRNNPDGPSKTADGKTLTNEEFKAALAESHPEYTEEQLEIMSVVADWNDGRTVAQGDIPESTIVTDPYFTDAFVSIALKSSLGQ